MSKKVTGILIDVINERTTVQTITDELESYYCILNCDTIDMQTRKIGAINGREYTIVCDDEGLIKCMCPKISAIDNLGQPMFVGNLFIINIDDEGNACDLTAEDIEYIEEFIIPQGTLRYPNPYPILHQVEYLV